MAGAARCSAQPSWSGRCFNLRAITQLGTPPDVRRPVHSQRAIQRLHGSRVRMLEGEGSQSRTQVDNCGHRARLATPVDERGSCAIEGERAVVRNCEIKGSVDSRKWDLPAKDISSACYDCIACIGSRHPAPQAPALIPIAPDLVLVV